MKRGLFGKNFAQRRIALISIVLIIATALLLTLISSIFYSRLTASSYTSDAERLQKALTELLTDTDISDFDVDPDISYDEEGSEESEGPEKEQQDSGGGLLLSSSSDNIDPQVLYEYLREYMRGLCELTGAKYTYLFNIVDERSMKYIITIAADEETDKIVGKERGFGVTVEIPDYDLNNIRQAEKGELVGPCHVDNHYGNVLTFYFPVYQNGEIVCLAGIDFDVSTISKEAISYVVRTVLIVTAVLTLVLALLMLVMRKKIFTPLKRLSMQMNAFDPEHEHAKLNLRSYYEIEEINSSFSKLSDEIIGYIRNIRDMADERAKTAAELNIARSIQIGMVPEHFTLSGTGYEICAGTAPAKEVGGDFYGCFEKDGKVFTVIADVSGKGIAAALFMAMTKNLLKGKLMSGLSPADALNSANDDLCAENPEGMFVTVFAAVLDPTTGELIYANAGHTRPLLTDRSGKRFIVPDPGIALGLFEDAGISNEYMIMEDGQSLTFYTDGVTEAVSAQKELFGEQRLLDAVSEGTAGETAASVTDAVARFSEGCEQADDITFTVLRFTVDGKRVCLELPPDMSSVEKLRSELLSLIGDSERKMKIILACEEILVNIIDYSGTDRIGVILNRRGSSLTLRLEDSGKPFDPLTEMPDEKEFEDYDTGGMGIRMLVQIAERTSYANISGKNILPAGFEL